jgi:hypothetical protein
MRSSVLGTGTSEVQVNNVDAFGLWLLVRGKEFFLPYEEYPWFREARIADILNVSMANEGHLRWPALDVDLCVESIEHPEGSPLVYDGAVAASGRRPRARRPGRKAHKRRSTPSAGTA